jgi:hypothetical protein
MSVLLALSEKAFQRMVREGLEQRGYWVFVFPNMKLTRAGWVDLTFLHPANPHRIYFWELKRERDSRVRPEQERLIDALKRIPGAVIDARIVKPSDWWLLKEEV